MKLGSYWTVTEKEGDVRTPIVDPWLNGRNDVQPLSLKPESKRGVVGEQNKWEREKGVFVKRRKRIAVQLAARGGEERGVGGSEKKLIPSKGKWKRGRQLGRHRRLLSG